MTQEDKELLLKDLSAKFPYGIIINVNGRNERIDEINPFEEIITCGFQSFDVDECKPYLRPMSSMTEEEYKEYSKLWDLQDEFPTDADIRFKIDVFDWLNAHHFDYRGLIEKGLAISVTEENNSYKE